MMFSQEIGHFAKCLTVGLIDTPNVTRTPSFSLQMSVLGLLFHSKVSLQCCSTYYLRTSLKKLRKISTSNKTGS